MRERDKAEDCELAPPDNNRPVPGALNPSLSPEVSPQPTTNSSCPTVPRLSLFPIRRSDHAPIPRERINVTGIDIDNINQDEALSVIDGWLGEPGSRYLIVVNAAKLVEADRNAVLRRALLDADLVTADGMSVVWSSRLLGRSLKQRVTGIDLFERLVGHAAGRGAAVYFLGAREESVRGLVERFTVEYPNLRVAGYRKGYFTSAETNDVISEIRRSGADLLFVAMGSPRQDTWIASNLTATGARFAMGVGGAFDHLSGRSRRAPAWMQRAGLEWFYRLLREPRRLWRRYLVGNSVFIAMVVRQFAAERARFRRR